MFMRMGFWLHLATDNMEIMSSQPWVRRPIPRAPQPGYHYIVHHRLASSNLPGPLRWARIRDLSCDRPVGTAGNFVPGPGAKSIPSARNRSRPSRLDRSSGTGASTYGIISGREIWVHWPSALFAGYSMLMSVCKCGLSCLAHGGGDPRSKKSPGAQGKPGWRCVVLC